MPTRLRHALAERGFASCIPSKGNRKVPIAHRAWSNLAASRSGRIDQALPHISPIGELIYVRNGDDQTAHLFTFIQPSTFFAKDSREIVLQH